MRKLDESRWYWVKADAVRPRTEFLTSSNAPDGRTSDRSNGLPAERFRPVGDGLPDLAREFLPVSERIVLEAIEKANRVVQGAQTQLEYSVHERTGQIMVKVKNSESGEVIREIPPEKILDLVANIWDMLGILVDEKV